MIKQQSKRDAYQLRSGIQIYPAQEEAINEQMAELLEKIPARFLLLTDVAGQVVCSKGEHAQVNLVALSSLVAGDLAASQEIARLTGEYQDYQIILREGQTSHIFICEAGPYLALLAQVTNDAPLGWARMMIQQGVQKLAAEMEKEPQEEFDLGAELTLDMDDDMDANEDALSDLFGQALDELWTE